MPSPAFQVADRMASRAMIAASLFGLAFAGFAVTDRPKLAAACAVAMAFAAGATVAAELIARRFR